MTEAITKTITTTTYFDFWSAFGTIATALAAVGTLLTIRKMNEQRKDGFRPKIIISGPNTSVHNYNKEDGIYSTEFKLEDRKPVYYQFINIGNGVAEDITVTIITPIREFLEYIEKIDTDNEFKFTVFPNKISVNKNGNVHSTIKNIEEQFFRKDMLVNINTIPNDDFEIAFKLEYITLLLITDYLRRKNKIPLGIINAPKVRIIVNYHDFEGKNYSSRFKMDVREAGRSFKFSFTNADIETKLGNTKFSLPYTIN